VASLAGVWVMFPHPEAPQYAAAAVAEREEADEPPAWLHVTMSEERGGAAPPPRIAVGEFQDERDR